MFSSADCIALCTVFGTNTPMGLLRKDITIKPTSCRILERTQVDNSIEAHMTKRHPSQPSGVHSIQTMTTWSNSAMQVMLKLLEQMA